MKERSRIRTLAAVLVLASITACAPPVSLSASAVAPLPAGPSANPGTAPSPANSARPANVAPRQDSPVDLPTTPPWGDRPLRVLPPQPGIPAAESDRAFYNNGAPKARRQTVMLPGTIRSDNVPPGCVGVTEGAGDSAFNSVWWISPEGGATELMRFADREAGEFRVWYGKWPNVTGQSGVFLTQRATRATRSSRGHTPEGEWSVWRAGAADQPPACIGKLPALDVDDAPYLLSADGRVVVRRLDGQHVGVWRISASGVSDAGLAEGDLLIGSIAVSPDSQWLATGSMRTRRKDLEHLSSTGVQLWRIDGSAPQKAGKIETENPVHPDFCTSRVLSVSGWTAGDSYWAIDRNGTARFVYQMPANLDGREPNGSTARPDPEHDREFQVVTYAGKQGSGISVIYVLVVIEGDSVTSPRSVELPATPSRSVQLVALQGRAPLVSLSCPETRELHIARSNGGDAEPVGPYRSVVEYRRPNTSADEVYLKAWRWDDDGADIIRVDEDPFADNDEECGLLFHLVGHLPPDALLSRLHPCGTRFGVGDSAEGVSVWLMDADGDVVIAGETIHWPASPAEPREWPRVTVDAHWEVPQGTVLQPGDEVTLVVRANNAGTGTIHHLVGMLSADPAEAVAGAPQPVVLGSIEPGETVTRHLQLVATEAMVRRPTTWTLTWQDKFGFALKPQTWTAETGDGAPLLDVDAAWVEDLAASDGDGILQAGEIGWLVLRLTNRGESATPAQMAVGVELAGSDDVSLLDDAANSAVMLDPLPPGESAEARFRIGVRPRCEAKWFEARVSGVGLIHPRFVCGNHKPAQLPVCVPIGYSLRADSERRFRELLHTDHNDPEAWRAYLDSAESLYASADPLPPSWQSWVAERALGCAIALQDLPEVVRWADRELAVASDASRRIFLQQSKCMAQILLGRVADAEATLSQLDAPSENLTESLSFARAIRTTTGRRPAPDFTLPDLTDEKHTVTLSAFRGRVVIVNFWAAWCEPCLKLMNGDLKDLQSTFAERGLTIISIGQPWRGESAFRQAEEAKKWGFDWLKVYDTTSETRRAWKVTTIPHLVLIDRAGNVVLEGQDGSMPFVRQFLETECPADAADPDVPR